MTIVETLCPVQQITRGPFYHFFGYYDKCPWDVTGRTLLGMRVAFMDRPPTAAGSQPDRLLYPSLRRCRHRIAGPDGHGQWAEHPDGRL